MKILTNRQILMLEQSVLEFSFPIRFGKRIVWSTFTGYCGKCNRVLNTNRVRGFNYGFTTTVNVVFAISICEKCNNLNEFRFDVWEDGYLVTYLGGLSNASIIHASLWENILHSYKVVAEQLKQRIFML